MFTTFAELGLFTGIPQHENFSRVPQQLPTREMPPSSTPRPWPRGEESSLPHTYMFDGETRSTEAFFTDTDTAALLVLKDGAIRHERYALTCGPDVAWLSMSVAKSFVSALVGIAVTEGHLGSIEEPISAYVPVEEGSAYDGVAIKQVLQMSSGARWNEDYSDASSDVFRLGAALMGVGGSLDEFVATMVPESEAGTVCRYNSGDTQALGALLVRATGRPLAEYMHEKLGEPLGMTSPGYWIVDPTGMELAFGGLVLTARDFARLGELYRNGGVCGGKQVVPASWVRDSLTFDAPHLAPGQTVIADHHLDLGYGYQWWLPPGDRRVYSAIGVYNQFVYVDETAGVTIVKLSANRKYGTSADEADNRDNETLAFLRSITEHIR